MQFLSRSSRAALKERGAYGQPVLDLHRQLTSIIARRSGQAQLGALLAEPVRNSSSGEILWYTRQAGTVRKWEQLSAPEQEAVRASIDSAARWLLSVGREYLASDDRRKQADAQIFLATLGFDADEGTCRIDYTKAFLVDGVAVLTEWGCDPTDAVRQPVSLTNVVGATLPEPPGAAAVAEASPDYASTSPAVAIVPSKRLPAWWRGLWFLLGLLLALTITSLLMRSCAPLGIDRALVEWGPGVGVPIPPGAEDKERSLRDEIAALGAQLDERALECMAPEPTEEPPLALAEVPEPEPEPAVAPPAPPPVRQPSAACPVVRSTEVVLVLDASLSMRWDFNVDPRLEARLNEIDAERRRIRQRMNSATERMDFGAMLREGMQNAARLEALDRESERLFARLDGSVVRSRISVAKGAIEELVRASDPDVSFGFVAFNQCGVRQPFRRYGPDQRAALLNQVRRTELGPYTALAETLRDLARHINGGQSPETPVNVVLLADGDNNCPGDPCAIARALKRDRPHLYINTIAIGGNAGRVSCVSELTGGRFIKVEDAARLGREIAIASGQELAEHCR